MQASAAGFAADACFPLEKLVECLQIIAVDGAGHTARAAAAAGKLRGRDGDDVDALLDEQLVGDVVAVIGDDAPGRNAEGIRAVVPLLALRGQQIAAAAADQVDRRQLELKSQNILQLVLEGGELQLAVLVEHHLVDAQRALDLGMDGELVVIDHRKDGIEVHERAGLGDIEGKDLLEAGVLQQVAGKGLRAGDGGALGQADRHDVLGEHEHVAALDGVAVGKVVPLLVLLRGKVTVVEVHILEQQALALAGGRVHPVDVDAVADAGAGVAGEVEVGHRVGDEGIVVLNEVHEGGGLLGGDLAALDAGDQLGDHLLGGHIQEIARHGRAQALGMDLADVQEVVHQLDLAGGIGDGLGDLVDVVDDLDAVLTQNAGEVIMLLLRDLEVGHVVEQQTLERSGRQRLQLLAGAMQQDLIELTDL